MIKLFSVFMASSGTSSSPYRLNRSKGREGRRNLCVEKMQEGRKEGRKEGRNNKEVN